MEDAQSPVMQSASSRLAPYDSATTIELVAQGRNWAAHALRWRSDSEQASLYGALATGPVVSLLSHSFTAAVANLSQAKVGIVSRICVEYLKPLRKQRLFARGECFQFEAKTALVRGILYTDKASNPVASAFGIVQLA